MVNNMTFKLNEDQFERMDGLVKTEDRENFYKACVNMYNELIKEGFEPDDAMQYLHELPEKIK